MTYRTIVADPPWEHESFSRGSTNGIVTRPLPYPAMSIEDILDLPVERLADRDCFLWLWTTNMWLEQSFDVIRAWGFQYRQTLVWQKLAPNPNSGSLAPNAEFLLIGRRGQVRWQGGRSARIPNAVLQAVSPGHSEKPDAFLDLVERVSPGPYLELFARRQRLGWDTWGNESLEHVEL